MPSRIGIKGVGLRRGISVAKARMPMPIYKSLWNVWRSDGTLRTSFEEWRFTPQEAVHQNGKVMCTGATEPICWISVPVGTQIVGHIDIWIPKVRKGNSDSLVAAHIALRCACMRSNQIEWHDPPAAPTKPPNRSTRAKTVKAVKAVKSK